MQNATCSLAVFVGHHTYGQTRNHTVLWVNIPMGKPGTTLFCESTYPRWANLEPHCFVGQRTYEQTLNHTVLWVNIPMG